MARSKLPDPLARRHLVERELTERQALATAEAYLEAGRTLEAVDFLVKAGADERLEALRAEAVETGDFFLMRALARAVGEAPDRATWLALAEAAEAAGKARYAQDARRQAARGDSQEID
jgi:hypothetical protein